MMSFLRIYFIFNFLFLSCLHISAQENPFMEMTGKKYADYVEALNNEYIRFSNIFDTVEAQKITCQIREAAEKTGSIEWKLQAAYFEAELFGKKWYLYGNDLFPLEELYKMMLPLLEEAEKWNLMQVFKFRQRIINHLWDKEDYELAFELYTIQAKQLEKVTHEELPDKSAYLRMIAKAHYHFKDYAKAIYFYEKVLQDEGHWCTPNAEQHARNDLGLAYRYGYNDLDRSDHYFRSLLNNNQINQYGEVFHNVWTGIAEGNLGHNMVLRGEYDQAIPLLKSGLERIVRDGDYGFAAGVAANLANVYLKKGDHVKAKYYIDLAREYYSKSPRDGTLPRLYETLGKYYAATGNATLSMAYIDSMLLENKKHEEKFNASQMLRVEQRQHLSEQRLKEEELHAEKIKSDRFKRTLTLTFIALLLIGGGFARYLTLYRKKQAAYRELVRKSQEWARVTPEIEKEVKQNEAPDEADLLIMKDIERLMQEDKPYKDAACSVDLVAKKLGAKRHYISNAINRCTNKSFSTYINEYRIKEAIQLLSKNDANIPTIDAIAFDVGFNDRHVFYRAFKKITGVSPTEFRRLV